MNKFGIALLVVVALPVAASADQLFFSNVVLLQNGGFSSVDLFSNLGQTFGLTNVNPSNSDLDFEIDIRGNSTGDTLLTKLTTPDFSLTNEAPIPPGVYPPFPTSTERYFLTFYIPKDCCYHPTPVNFVVDIPGSDPNFIVPTTGEQVNSFTYSFNVLQPVPEPNCFLLCSTGLACLAGLWIWRMRSNEQRL
jgi:hypothetical protein